MNKKKLLKKSRPVHKVEINGVASLYNSERRSVTPTRSSKQPVSTIAEFSKNLINSSCKTLKRKKPTKNKQKLTTTNSPLKPRTSDEFQEKNIFKNDKGATPLRNKLDAAFQAKKLIKIYRLTPSNSPLSGRSLVYSSRDQISQRSNCQNSEVRTVKKNEVFFEINGRSEKANLEYILDDHRNSVNSIILNSSSLYTGSQDYTIKKWRYIPTDPNPYRGKEYIEGQILNTSTLLIHNPKPVLHLSLIRPSILLACLPNSLKFFNNSTLFRTKKLDFSAKYLSSHNENCLLASLSSIYKLDLEKNCLISSISSENTTILHPYTESYYFSGDSKGHVKTLDLRVPSIISQYHSHFDSVTGIAFNDNAIYTCSQDGYLKHWDIRFNNLINSFNSLGSLKKIICIKDRILTGGDSFRIWTENYPIILSPDYCKDLTHKDNCILAAANNKVMVWNIQTVNTTNEYI